MIDISGYNQNISIGEVTVQFQRGLMLRAHFELFDRSTKTLTTIIGSLNINVNGWRATLVASHPLEFLLGALIVCKDQACNQNEGAYLDWEVGIVPPVFQVNISAHAQILYTFTFGVQMFIGWKDENTYEASFEVTPLQFLCSNSICALQITASRNLPTALGGPKALYRYTKISGQLLFVAWMKECLRLPAHSMHS